MKKKKPSYKKLRRAFLLTLGANPDLGSLGKEDNEFVDRVSKEILKKWSLDGTRKKEVAEVQG
jgi:hypothetical protein